MFPCDNIHKDPENFFEISGDAFIAASNVGIVCLWHSHTQGQDNFSVQDVNLYRALDIPFYLFSIQTGVERWISPAETLPYLGRPYLYGVHDCFSLVRDYYRQELGIEIDDFERLDPQEMNDPTMQIRMFDYWKAQGFSPLPENALLQKGDVLLQAVEAATPNHIGVIVDPEANVFYHHLLNRASEPAVYGGYWKQATLGVYRHARYC